MPPRRAAAAAAAAAVAAQAASDDNNNNTAGTAAAAGPSSTAAIEPSPVKTKFPTARIKRIMQADEEVGKVAQQTPIAVGKALELFMVALVTKSAEVARQRSSKRVSAQMLKQVVESDDQWDFLRDIVGKVEGEEKKGGGSQSQGRGAAAKAESSGTDEEGGAGGEGAAAVKKKRGGGRKKKVQ
jgi:histone H3/H4